MTFFSSSNCLISRTKHWIRGEHVRKRTGTVASYSQPILKLAGTQPIYDYKLFEEVRMMPEIMCEELHQGTTFEDLQLEDGDFVCIQKWVKQSDKVQNFNLLAFFEAVKTKIFQKAF
ncbi:hypothetical protein KFL_000110360 [Klebsormidium nitens]|uniref:Ubiquitin carboxyl-terminal hydrolase 7 ICP0-binding domain-containing protein n=1 Tax=Klebsormidium nitens TaxID=105231 RepID=A0A1Y1HMB4_KLENI|nr:hypothetical protein KFL_000110360 [Klebsormidium nitens]|eukprot:GAQ78339.1 hypothetical protein KFL_000110360 [Klebsormidium nitens]